MLTVKGGRARNEYQRLVLAIEDRWRERFGEQTLG
jgi:hypothetical protein